MAEQQFQTRSLKRKNVKNLALKPTKNSVEEKPKEATLEIGLEFKLDLRSEDLIPLKEVGAGNGGTVSKVKHATTGVIMARKVHISSLWRMGWIIANPTRSSVSTPRKMSESKSFESFN